MTKDELKKRILNGGRGSGQALRLLVAVYENQIAALEEEYKGNLSLKDEEFMCLETIFNTYKSEAKQIISGLLSLKSTCDDAEAVKRRFEVRERAEAFLKE